MRKISIIITMVICPLLIAAQNTAVDELFDKYAGKEGFTTVYVSKNLFKMISDIELDDPETEELVDNLETIKILAADDYENTEGINFYDEIIRNLPVDEYEELREKDGIIKELLLVVGGIDDNVLISIIGDIDLKKISKISKSMHGSSLEYLEKLEKDEK
jgi:hypothetical protein